MAQEKRFCPIQILIVVFFIAIIMGVLVPNYFSFQDNRHNKVTLEQAFSLQSAVKEYALIYGTYPSNMSQLVRDNLLLASGFQNPFSRDYYLPKISDDHLKLGEVVYEPLNLDKDSFIEGYCIIAYGKEFGKVVSVAHLCGN